MLHVCSFTRSNDRCLAKERWQHEKRRDGCVLAGTGDCEVEHLFCL